MFRVALMVVVTELIAVSAPAYAIQRERRPVAMPPVEEPSAEAEAESEVPPVEWTPPKFELQVSTLPLLLGPELDLRLEIRNRAKSSLIIRASGGGSTAGGISANGFGLGIGDRYFFIDGAGGDVFGGIGGALGGVHIVSEEFDEVIPYAEANALVGARRRFGRHVSLSASAGYRMIRFASYPLNVLIHGPLVEIVLGFSFDGAGNGGSDE